MTIITITESDRVDEISMTITESEKAVFKINFENGDEETFALERDRAEAFPRMIEDQYQTFDEQASANKEETDE